ncbi:hypothetical protein AWC21_00910 [Mycolicibacterium peregrinum]|nr:hypothetical protein AWC21_00910 [Mycolicibacterium peregrinum]
MADDPPPIDYTRRRTLDYRDLLDVEQWLDICKSSGTWPRVSRLAGVQFFLYERISGMPGMFANYEWSNKAAATNARRLPRYLTPELDGALHAHAEAFLRSHGIATEPVDWHPDVRLVDDLELPGRQNMEIDSSALHHLIRQEGLSIETCAERLGSTAHHVRYILSIDPAPAISRRLGRCRPTPEAVLPPARLYQLYEIDRRSTAEVGKLSGFSASVVLKLLRRYGMQVRSGRGR